jgi:MerR family mercuric resistance operon transcriptional regulator
MKTDSLTIGHLAKEADVNLETVRFYERRGLLAKPPRSASGYRLFITRFLNSVSAFGKLARSGLT